MGERAAPPRRRQRARLHLVAFDLARLGGQDLRSPGCLERWARLKSLLAGRSGDMTVVDDLSVSEDAAAKLVALGFEGVVLNSHAGRWPERSSTWRKLKAHHTVTATLIAVWPDRDSGVVEQASVETADGTPPIGARSGRRSYDVGSPTILTQSAESPSGWPTPGWTPTARCGRRA